jgi:MFS family permease
MEKNAATEAAVPSEGYAWYVVAVLVLAYTFSYIDRTILTLLVAPVRASLGISDVQLSLLHGLAFAFFYTFLGIPLGWLADRANRVRIIAIGILVWSVMTACCGLARNFWQMFLARIGVGIGEAALSPAAYSILADTFRPERVTLAISVYATGVYIGSGLALIVGGAVIAATPALDVPVVGRLEPWQVVFIAVGLPGVLVAALMKTVREPARRGLMRAPSTRAVQGNVNLGDTFRFIAARWRTYGTHFVGYAVLAMLWNGASSWIPTFFIRTHGWTVPEVGLGFGSAILVFGTAGIALGGAFSGWLRARGHVDANIRIGIISAIMVLPTGMIAPLLPSAGLALALFCVMVFFSSFPYGGAAAALQEITPNQLRALVSAIYLFVINLAGIGVGPTLVAAITQYGFADDAAIKYALSIAVAVTAPLAIVLLGLGLKPYRAAIDDAKTWQT